MQTRNVDFGEVYSPALEYSTLQILLSLFAQHGWERHSLEIETGFLYASLDQKLYAAQLDGFVLARKKNHVFILLKDLYGFKETFC